MESDVTVTTLADPEAMRPFDLTMTYRRTSDVWTPYVSRRLVEELRAAPLPKTARLPVARVQSNAYDRSGRNSYAAELSRYVKVGSYGRFATTVAETIARGRDAKLSAIATHKFTLAFENSVALDYVTEKFFDPLVAGSVPVYLGAPNVGDFAPADHCYINTADFAGPRQLAAYLDHLDHHDDEYQAFLAWKQRGPDQRFRALVETSAPRPFCRLAEIVAETRAATRSVPM
jgi:alpha-1,3-fucosyltransferase 10